MAINKNFVIKNGVQVATDLIVGDSTLKKVGIGTTVPGYTLHVGPTNAGGRGGIGVTDISVTGVGTVTNLNVTGFSTFANDVSVSGMVSAQALSIGTTEVIDRGMRLSGIASLDSTTIATIEDAIRVGPNSFSDLKVAGLSTFIGIATFATGLDVISGVSTFSGALRIGFAGTTDHAGVSLGATVGFGTSAFFQDGAAIYMGDDSDLKIFHDSSNSFVQDLGTGNLYVDSNSLQIRNAAGTETQATFAENGAASLYYDNGNVFQTTPQGVNVSGVTTSNRLNISGVSTFTSVGSNLIPDADGTRNIGAATSEWGDLFIDGTANIDTLVADTAKISDLTDNRVVIAGTSGELEDSGNLTFDGSTLAVTGDETVSGKVSVGSGVTASANGNIAAAGIVTANGGIVVGTGSSIIIGSAATIFSNGNVTISGIATVASDLVVLGNLDVTGDITYDEVSGRNLNISGVTTLGSGNGGVSGLLVSGAGYVGGGATVGSHAGIITYYGDGANLTGVTIGIGTTGDGSAGIHPVGYGVTYLEFKGAGFTTAYYDGNLGIATLCFQGGGGVGAAGTWTPEGSIGISTSKSVGINTVALNDPDVQGIGNSFQGLYIGNGMLMVDNALNGNHYIGTNFNGLMAGPVTINGVMTVDGNWAVV